MRSTMHVSPYIKRQAMQVNYNLGCRDGQIIRPAHIAQVLLGCWTDCRMPIAAASATWAHFGIEQLFCCFGFDIQAFRITRLNHKMHVQSEAQTSPTQSAQIQCSSERVLHKVEQERKNWINCHHRRIGSILIWFSMLTRFTHGCLPCILQRDHPDLAVLNVA